MNIDFGLLILFVLLWISIYGGLHYYAYRKLIHLIPGHKRILIFCLVVLAGLLFMVELLTHNGFAFLAYPLAGIAYSWMGLVFLFFVFSGPLDLIEMVGRRLRFFEMAGFLEGTGRTLFVVVLVSVLGLYGIIAARQINVEKVTLHSEKLSRKVSLMQISDLHLGILTSQTYISKLVKIINTLQPDIVVSTGDLVDMQLDDINGLTQELKKINAPLGKYAIYGNHEVFAGIKQSKQVIEESGYVLHFYSRSG
jgi:hypothetical protein